MEVVGNVTRLGEFSPLRHTVKTLWPFWKHSCSIWHNFEWIFIVLNGKILYKHSSYLELGEWMYVPGFKVGTKWFSNVFVSGDLDKVLSKSALPSSARTSSTTFMTFAGLLLMLRLTYLVSNRYLMAHWQMFAPNHRAEFYSNTSLMIGANLSVWLHNRNFLRWTCPWLDAIKHFESKFTLNL